MPLPYISHSGQHATLACRGQRDTVEVRTPRFPPSLILGLASQERVGDHLGAK